MDDLARLPVELKHDLDEVDEADRVTVLDRLGGSPRKKDSFHLRAALVEL